MTISVTDSNVRPQRVINVKEGNYDLTLTISKSPFHNCQICTVGGIEQFINYVDGRVFSKGAWEDLISYIKIFCEKNLVLMEVGKKHKDWIVSKYPNNTHKVLEFISTNDNQRYLILYKP
jgi:hypothetical protein